MNLKDIITIKSINGLFRLLKVTRGGLLLETFDEKKKKIIKNIGFSKATPLDNVAIYLKSNKTLPISEVFLKINANKKKLENIDLKADTEKIKNFIKSIIPEYDETKLHVRQIQKILNWYKIIFEFQPSFFHQNNENDQLKNTGQKNFEDTSNKKEIENNKQDIENTTDLEKKNSSSKNL